MSLVLLAVLGLVAPRADGAPAAAAPGGGQFCHPVSGPPPAAPARAGGRAAARFGPADSPPPAPHPPRSAPPVRAGAAGPGGGRLLAVPADARAARSIPRGGPCWIRRTG